MTQYTIVVSLNDQLHLDLFLDILNVRVVEILLGACILSLRTRSLIFLHECPMFCQVYNPINLWLKYASKSIHTCYITYITFT